MSVILRPRTRAFALRSAPSGRSLAAGATGMAVILVLLLAAVIPARTDASAALGRDAAEIQKPGH